MSNYGLIGIGNTPNTYMPNGTLNSAQGILSQGETQKVLINRAGNKALNLDPWEGFESVRKMDNNLTDLPQNYDRFSIQCWVTRNVRQKFFRSISAVFKNRL